MRVKNKPAKHYHYCPLRALQRAIMDLGSTIIARQFGDIFRTI
jgi:hypothetical protein